MFGKNKRSLIVLFIGLFWMGYVSFTAYHFYTQAVSQTNFVVSEKIERLEYILETSASSLITDHPDSLSDKLIRAKELNFVNFYILQENSEVIFFNNNSGKVEDLNHKYANFNMLIKTDQMAFKTLKVGDYILTAGVYTDKNKILIRTAKNMSPLFIKDVAIVTSLVGLIAFFLLRDILSISRILSSRNRQGLNQVKTTSKEANLILNASFQMENENDRLNGVNEVYGNTIGPALKHEISLNREAPYQFNATVCRVDLNGYTQMFFEKGVQYLTQVLNEYFARAREVIERYDGLIYQFVGDEIVFLVKEDSVQPFDVRSMSTAIIRDLFKEAELVEKNLPREAGHYFKLKASYAYGTMNFIALDQGHAFSGTPLIESVRLLSLIHDKTHQILSMDYGSYQSSCHNLAFICEKEHLTLKGFKQDSTYVRCRDFHSIEWVFENKQWDLLSYFRHDQHIEFVLKRLLILSPQNKNTEIEDILKAMHFHKLTETNLSSEIFERTLSNFITSQKERLLSEKALSSLMSLYVRIIPANKWTDELTALVEPLLNHPDSRTVANALVLLGQKGYDILQLWDLMFSKDSRVAADTIYEIAQRKLSWDMVKALDKLAISAPTSARYAQDKIISYYKKIDPVFAGSNEIIQKVSNLKVDKKIAV